MLGGDEALLRARKVVITGLVPVIHVLFGMRGTKDVDARHKAGHDEPPDGQITNSLSTPISKNISVPLQSKSLH
jgi:hypothetical protein